MQNAKAHCNNLTLQQIRFAFFCKYQKFAKKTVKVKNKSATTYQQQFSFTPLQMHGMEKFTPSPWRKIFLAKEKSNALTTKTHDSNKI